ncbi:tyrosine-type recombinase/integrase [Kitasatospora sp. NBC_01287]|uniref:tyrosine-type recombinase/integrase n=1 Tax=Kitasatospora sp. NBC_01287 TaxID=2903573 RepID=UPI002255A798|nr:tyrosine-type recombinase/integrase [Kitasatospora sp. NBC_01287]MCX4750313.1 tyrosine-type recombinase/integrase [Kitasatospora sp. NBC_01287]
MGAELLESMRDASGLFQAEELQAMWDGVPQRFRTVELTSGALGSADLAAFLVATHQRSFRLRFGQLPEPMDREMAWCCWRIVELGGRVPVGALGSMLTWLARAVEDDPELRGSLMDHTPRAWERAVAAAFARHNGRLPSRGWLQNTTSLLRRCYQMLWSAYDQRAWWQREVWDPALDPRIPRRTHEPQGDHSLYFHQMQPLWLRHGVQWYLRVSLETGDMTWSTARARRSGLQVFADWIADRQPAPSPWLGEDPAAVRVFMLDFLSHVRAQIARAGPNRGKPLSRLRVNDIVTDVEKFYAFMADSREAAAQALAEPDWLELGPYHAMLWRRGEKGRPTVQPERWEVIDDTAFSQIMANLHLLGAPVEEGGFDDEQLMRIVMLQARLGRRISEVRMLDRDPLFALDQLTRPDGQEAEDGAFVAKLRYQQTKIEQAPDSILVDAEIVTIITGQRQWADAHLGPRWATGVTPKYLFLAHKMNRHADKPYPMERVQQTLSKLARRLDIRDSAGRLVDFNRTHRFRHTRATSLLNAGVPIHVVQRYFGHLSPTMVMHYAQTLAETHEREFLRYRKITADARELTTDPRDLYDMLELDKRTDRILPNGLCLLPPRQVCAKGNACLTCDKFATDATYLPELTSQRDRTVQLVEERQRAFTARTGQPMGEDNIWLTGRRQEQDALGRIILKLEATRLADEPQAVRGAGVGARADAITRCQEGS